MQHLLPNLSRVFSVSHNRLPNWITLNELGIRFHSFKHFYGIHAALQ